jgi:hypothetical protein
MALALATARFYCMNVGHRSEALTGPHPCGRGPGVGWRNIPIALIKPVRTVTSVISPLPRSFDTLRRICLLKARNRGAKNTPQGDLRESVRELPEGSDSAPRRFAEEDKGTRAEGRRFRSLVWCPSGSADTDPPFGIRVWF